jgi:NhaP-type Na+/H+ or K+/H+ antiporter
VVHAYGFLAVFAAGLALGRTGDPSAQRDGAPAMQPALEEREKQEPVDPTVLPEADAHTLATSSGTAPAYLSQAVLGFCEQLERIGEVGLVVLLGGTLTVATLAPEALWFAPLLFLVVRPLSVLPVFGGAERRRLPRALIAWFGVRGIGSLYYLAYAMTHELPGAIADRLVALTLTTIAMSVVVHGVSVTPLMQLNERARPQDGRARRR